MDFIVDAESQEWRRRGNVESRELYKGPKIIEVANRKKMKWDGHVARAEEMSTIKRVPGEEVDRWR